MDAPQVEAYGKEAATLAAVSQSGRSIAVLVLGMHRSGTSALSGALSLLGVSVPGDLLPPSKDNQKGFFENRRIVEFHDRLLEEFGSRWDDPLPLGQECFRSPAAQAAARELATLLQEEFGHRAAVLVKDPRMCRLVPVWIEALALIDRRPVAVLPHRHPLEVAASLQRRDSFSRAHALALWLQHVLAAEQATRGLPRCFTLYDDLLYDWRSVARKIGEELNFAWGRDRARVEAEIDAFLTSELRHHRSDRAGLVAHDALHGLCARTWEALASLRTDADDAAAQATLDEVKAELDAALGVLGPLVAVLDRDRLRVQQQGAAREQELLAQQAELEAQARAAAARREELENQLRREVEQREELENQLRREVEQREELENQLRREVEQREELENQLRREAEQHQRTRQIAQQQLDAAERRREAEVAAAQASRENTQRQLDAILRSTAWRMSHPLRSVGGRLPRPVRRALRGSAKIAWWTLTLRLPAKIRARRRLLAQMRAVATSDLFDAAWYLQRYPDVAATGLDPALHYVLFGAAEHRNPGPGFDAAWYLQRYPDIAAGGINPLLHYIEYGAAEGREKRPVLTATPAAQC